jgi:hypothetical protein
MRLYPLIKFLLLILTLASVHRLLAQEAPRLNGHRVVLDAQGKLLSWVEPQERAYDHVVRLGWDFILNRVPVESNGLKTYLTYATFDPATLHGTEWPHDPAGLYAMFVDSALGYYAYSGDSKPIDAVRQMLDYQLAHGTTPAGWAWSNVPYSSSDPGSQEYFGADDTKYCRHEGDKDHCGRGDGHYALEPDKVAELGIGYLKFYELTGEGKYRDAALACAQALAGHVRAGDVTHSPWPFRVFAHTNVAREEYSAQVIAAIRLFDELKRLGLDGSGDYLRVRKIAWDWLMKYPMRNHIWSAYFEDIPIDTDLLNWNQYSPLEIARYLLQHPESDSDWRKHAEGLINWVERTFAVDVPATEHYRWVQQEPVQYGQRWGASAISEQTQQDMDKMGSHTGRYASVCALFYEKTGDESYKEKAFRSFNWATYMVHDDGLITEAMAEDNFWYSDGYADYIRQFLAGMAAVPEWAPPKENHLLRSTSVVTKVSYGTNELHYSTFDPDATETLRLAFTPVQITVGGNPLTRREDLSRPGWVLDPATSVVRIQHHGAKDIVVSGS